MARLFVPTLGPTDWRRLLADPQKQWKVRKSAYESAVAWEAARRTARGLPPAIERLFDSSPAFAGASLLLGIPEHQVELAGGGHPSQTDLWALVSTPGGVASVAVEAKAGESFDRLVSEWLEDTKPSSGKRDRLSQLCGMLEIPEASAFSCRYQLMHRSVSAVLEARRFQLSTAVFLVHAFGNNEDSFKDYFSWAGALGCVAERGQLQPLGLRGGVALWIAWVDVEPADDPTVRAAL